MLDTKKLTPTQHFDLCLAEFERAGWGDGRGIGKRFDPHAHPGVSTFFDRRAEMAWALIQSAQDRFPKLTDVYFDFVDNSRVGAWAWPHDHRNFIAYSAATEHVLLAVFGRILAENQVFSFLCGDSDESPEHEVWTTLAADVRTVATVKAAIPKDTRRKVLALWLQNAVADFIVRHEMEHFLQGHCRYRNRYFPLSPLIDPSRPSTKDEAALVQQTQEMCADAQAVWTSLFRMETFIDDPSEFPAPMDEYGRNPQVMMFLWLFAIFVFCRLNVLHHPNGDQPLAGADLESGTHPLWRFRQLMIVEYVEGYVGHKAGLGHFGTIPNLTELVGLSLGQAEHAIRLVTNQPLPTNIVADWYHPDVRAYRQKLIDIWRGGVRDAHQPFKLGDWLPD